MAVVITVAVDGRLTPGLLPKNEVPIIRPITDLTRLQRARRLVSSLDVVQSKSSLINEVKAQVINAVEEEKIIPSQIVLRPGAQAEIIKCRAYADALMENYSAFNDNPLNEKAVLRFAAATWFSACLVVIDKYIIGAVCGDAPEKLLDCVFQSSIPRSFFTKMTVRVAELRTQAIDDILFPRRLSRMMVFRKKEIRSFKTIPDAFKNSFSVLKPIADLYHDDDDESILYPIPPNFKDHFRSFSDLPQIDRSRSDSTTLSISLIQMMFAAIPPKALTLDALELHESSFLRDIPEDLDPKTINDCSCPFDLNYDPESSQSLKVQYKDYFLAKDIPLKGFVVKNLSQLFYLDKKEVNALPLIIYFTDELSKEPNPGIKSMFDPAKLKPIPLDSKYVDRFRMIKPTPAKPLNSGAPSSELTKNSLKFLANLKKANADAIFIENVRGYLLSFVNQSFQDLAVKTMAASMQAREITVTEETPHSKKNGDHADYDESEISGDESLVGFT